MKKIDLFEKMHTSYVNGKNPLLSSKQDEIFNNIAKQMGIKRGSVEWSRFIWVNMLGVSPEVFDNK